MKELVLPTKNGSNGVVSLSLSLSNTIVHSSVAQSYVARSQKNVDDSDGTLTFRLYASSGTDNTIGYCLTHRWRHVSRFDIETKHKPCLVITDFSDYKNVSRIREFIKTHKIETLNVAGHRDTVVVKDFTQKIKSLLLEALTQKI